MQGPHGEDMEGSGETQKRTKYWTGEKRRSGLELTCRDKEEKHEERRSWRGEVARVCEIEDAGRGGGGWVAGGGCTMTTQRAAGDRGGEN